jgi:hypothetical protein
MNHVLTINIRARSAYVAIGTFDYYEVMARAMIHEKAIGTFARSTIVG